VITLYTWTTPNGRKASIMLEEVNLSYAVRPINLQENEQHDPDFLRVSPNNKIPAIVDNDGGKNHTIFETGAILIYLAEKTGKLLSANGPERTDALEWLFWSTSGLAPMLGQWNYFANRAKDKQTVVIERFSKEVARLYSVLEKRLSEVRYLAGDYSVADISAFTWTKAMLGKFKAQNSNMLPNTPAIDRWLESVANRGAVIRGLDVPPESAGG
jgi:GST-like protein